LTQTVVLRLPGHVTVTVLLAMIGNLVIYCHTDVMFIFQAVFLILLEDVDNRNAQ